MGCIITAPMQRVSPAQTPTLDLQGCGAALLASQPLTALWEGPLGLAEAQERAARNYLWSETGVEGLLESKLQGFPEEVQVTAMLQHMLDENCNYGYTCTYG